MSGVPTTSRLQPNFPPEVLARVSPELLASMCKVRIPGGLVPLRPWPSQRRVLKVLADPDIHTVVILKARQTGMTQIVTLWALYRAISIAASHSLIVSKGDREAQEAGGRGRQMYASLPQAVKYRHAILHKNLEEFRLLHPDLPQPDPNTPLEDVVTCDIRNLPAGAGRSYSSDLLIADEYDHWDDAEERMAAILPTLSPGGKLVIASTANGFGGPLHLAWNRARSTPGHAAIFISALERPGRSPEWVMAQRAALGAKGAQEYPLTPEEAFIATGHGVFDAAALSWQIDNLISPPGGMYEFHYAPTAAKRTDRPEGWAVWQQPQRGRRYVVAADPAGGGPHSDPSAACVYDIDAGIQVAAYHGRPLPHVFAQELASAGALYNRGLLVPEANNTGQAVIAHLTNLGAFPIYEEERFAGPSEPVRKTYGWNTNARSKQFAVDALRTGVAERTLGIRDGAAIEEMMRFAETAPGRYAARTGHDDRVLSHAIAAAMLIHSRRTMRPIAGPSLSSALTREVMDEQAGY